MPATAEALRPFFPAGLFTYPAGEWITGCIENPTIYRAGQIMLAIVSHEREGVLELTSEEQRAVATLGIATRANAEWV